MKRTRNRGKNSRSRQRRHLEVMHGSAIVERVPPNDEEVEMWRVRLRRAARRHGIGVASGWGRMLAVHTRGGGVPAQEVVAKIVARADVLGIGHGVLARAASAYPAVLLQPVDVLVERISGIADLLGVNGREARRLAGREPRLLLQRAETTAGNLTHVAREVGLDMADAGQVVRRWPGVLAQRADAIMTRMSALGAMLGLTPEGLHKTVVRQPRLLGVTPERLAGNLQALVQGLAVGEEVVIKCVRRMPQLLYQRPATVLGRLSGIAVALRIDEEQVRMAALRQPALFLRRPESVAERARWLVRIGRVCGDRDGIGQLMQRVPIAVNFSMESLRMRYILACLLSDGLSYRGVLLVAAERAESRIEALLVGRHGGARARELLARMRARGLLVGSVSGLAVSQHRAHGGGTARGDCVFSEMVSGG